MEEEQVLIHVVFWEEREGLEHWEGVKMDPMVAPE